LISERGTLRRSVSIMRDWTGEEWLVSDIHIHFGRRSSAKLTLRQKDLKGHLEKLNGALIFPFDLELVESNQKLIQMLPKLSNTYGLIRFQLVDYLDNFSDFADLLDKPKIAGIKLHPTYDRLPVTHPLFNKVFQELEKRDLLTLIHCGRWRDVSHCRLAFQRAKQHPSIKIIIAHMGGSHPTNAEVAIRLAKKHPNTYLDTSNCCMPWLIERAVKALGEERFFFGSDFPWGALLPNLYAVLETNLSKTHKQAILHHNFEALMEDVFS
jgi:predicted TIM-barrel fold metal-dependent hydrolase